MRASEENEIAIEITEKIQRDIVSLIISVARVDESRVILHPSYYQIRQTILDVLLKYVKTCYVKYNYSPMEVERMINNKEYWQSVHRRLAMQVGEKIFEAGLYNKNDFVDERRYFGSKTFVVGILDYSKIEESTKSGGKEK